MTHLLLKNQVKNQMITDKLYYQEDDISTEFIGQSPKICAEAVRRGFSGGGGGGARIGLSDLKRGAHSDCRKDVLRA
jgi:hypothetical protein